MSELDTLLFASIDPLHPCISLGELKKRCKDAIEQKTPDEQAAWIRRHVVRSGFSIYVERYRYADATTTADSRRIYNDIKQHLENLVATRTTRSMEAAAESMLGQIPELDSKLKRRIIAALTKGVLLPKHVQYCVTAALRPGTRDPGRMAQTVFRNHIAERFRIRESDQHSRNMKIQITIEHEIDPYINEQ